MRNSTARNRSGSARSLGANVGEGARLTAPVYPHRLSPAILYGQKRFRYVKRRGGASTTSRLKPCAPTSWRFHTVNPATKSCMADMSRALALPRDSRVLSPSDCAGLPLQRTRDRAYLQRESGQRTNQAFRIKLIENPLTLSLASHQSSVFEHRKVSRHGRCGHFELCRKLRSCQFGLRKVGQYLPTWSGRERFKDFVCLHISIVLANVLISKMCNTNTLTQSAVLP